MQEAVRRGLDASDEYKNQVELARQSILIRELFNDQQNKDKVTDADIKAEYDKFVAANGGKEYRARHILVEKEDEARDIVDKLKKGGLTVYHAVPTTAMAMKAIDAGVDGLVVEGNAETGDERRRCAPPLPLVFFPSSCRLDAENQ